MNKKPLYWIIPNYLSKKDIVKINKIISKKGSPEPEKNKAMTSQGKIKFTTSKILGYNEVKIPLRNLPENCYAINQDKFGFALDTFPLKDYVVYNQYKIGQKYEWHTDVENQSNFQDMKLTVLLNISPKSYEGGLYQIFWQEEHTVHQFMNGALLLFPSICNHRVTPVIQGDRRTLTLFLKGPLLR